MPPCILLRVGDQALYAGIDESRAKQWASLRLHLSMQKTAGAFRGCKQLSVAFDPSTYNGEETAVAVAYACREGGIAAYLPVKVVPPNKHVRSNEISMSHDVQEIVAAGLQDRWAAYKERAGEWTDTQTL